MSITNKQISYNMPEYSFIIPVTRKKDCRLLLNSILCNTAGTKVKYEIILITDKNNHIINKNNLHNVKTIATEHTHPSVKRNIGVSNSSGRYLCFLDDDTLINSGWLNITARYFKRGFHIICGPSTFRDGLIQEKISDFIYTSVLGEANTVYQKPDKYFPKFEDIYLNNCSIKRDVWEAVGGFNEFIDYHADDTEFFYIAKKMGFNAVWLKGTTVKHKRRYFPFQFLKYQFTSKKGTGINTVLLPEIYLRIKGVQLILLSYLLLIICFFNSCLLMPIVFIYFLGIIIFTLSGIKKMKYFFIILPIAFFLNHIAVYLGFTLGFWTTLIRRNKFKNILKLKKSRYAKI